MPPRFFVTATDTGVGKTQVACALLSLMADAGLNPVPLKPYESGCVSLAAPSDALALRRAAKSAVPLDRVCLYRFRAPVAPGVAAMRLGERPSWSRVLANFRRFDGQALVMEGAGGLFVPLDARHDVIDLIEATKLPVVLVARAELGTLNHTALSVEALRSRGIRIRAVVLSESTRAKDVSRSDNAELIRRRQRVEVLGPVRFEPRAARRHEAFKRELAPLLSRTAR